MESTAAMRRLDFRLPDFTRLSWTSDEARALWQPRIERINVAWAEIEWRAIERGIRRCALVVVPAGNLVDRAAAWALAGLNGLPLEIQGLGHYGYSATTLSPVLGAAFGYRVVIGAPADVAEFKRAYDAADNTAIGRMLGYPDCCQQFFEQVWVDAAMIDTTWPMAAGTPGASGDAERRDVSGPLEANILWRWMSVRAVPHLPCKFDCEATVEFGKRLLAVGRDVGYAEEVDWIEEILSWPAEWSALHGIAEIKTPVMKASTRTDATPVRYTVRRLGERYPAEGARALGFPFNVPRKPRLTASSHFRLGLRNPIGPARSLPEWYARDNGFTSSITMERAHAPIVELASEVLGENAGNVLDLGCGNGALLKRLCERLPAIVPFGIESDPERSGHVAEVLPRFAGNIVTGDMFTSALPWPDGRRYALALLMPGRLLEANAAERAALEQRLAAHCDALLVYAYGDWLTKYGDLRGLAQAAGLALLQGTTEKPSAGLARLVD